MVAFNPLYTLAVMTAVPGAIARTFPLASTFATSEFELVYVTGTSVLFHESTLAGRDAISPTFKDLELKEKDNVFGCS